MVSNKSVDDDRYKLNKRQKKKKPIVVGTKSLVGHFTWSVDLSAHT